MTFTVTCVNCGISFEAERSSAKFHSPNCRVAYSRKSAEKKQEQVSKFTGKAKLIDPTASVEDVKQALKEIKNQKLEVVDPAHEKGYPLSEDELDIIAMGWLDEGALLKAPRVVREKWVAEACPVEPMVNENPTYQGGLSLYGQQRVRTFGSGNPKQEGK